MNTLLGSQSRHRGADCGNRLLLCSFSYMCIIFIGNFRFRSKNGKQEYTAFRQSTSWINFTYGQKWKPALFVGYTKNLGTGQSLADTETLYGMGLDIDQSLITNLNLSYNLPHWQFGFEGSVGTAWYCDVNARNGCVENTHTVTNFRLLGLMMYYF